MHSCTFSLDSPIFSPFQPLSRSDFTDESAWSRIGSTVFGFECRMRGEKILIWKRPSAASFHSLPPFFSLCHLYPVPRAMKSLPVGSECSSDLCGDGMSCCSFLGAADVRVKENMLRPEIYVFKLEDESAPSPALDLKYQSNPAFLLFMSNCFHSHQTVFTKFIWL